ncbi:hypothetical protein ACVDG5_021130 [Mesorhizobium sp. ORM6]
MTAVAPSMLSGIFVPLRRATSASIASAMSANRRSMERLTGAIGERTIAEFVERDGIVAALKAIGIDYAQGYGIARPKPSMPRRCYAVGASHQPLRAPIHGPISRERCDTRPAKDSSHGLG